MAPLPAHLWRLSFLAGERARSRTGTISLSSRPFMGWHPPRTHSLHTVHGNSAYHGAASKLCPASASAHGAGGARCPSDVRQCTAVQHCRRLRVHGRLRDAQRLVRLPPVDLRGLALSLVGSNPGKLQCSMQYTVWINLMYYINIVVLNVVR